jgi:CheY-like chemotaxis protein
LYLAYPFLLLPVLPQKDGGGSGLGLHITKRIVEQHGGTIQMFSDGLNTGSVTIIELPLFMHYSMNRIVSKTNVCLVDADTPIPTVNESVTALHKCLVVDDSLPNRKMLVRLLERAGHTCLSATNGQEAVEIMDTDHTASLHDKGHVPIDSILMDYEMPVMNGPDATRIIRGKGYSNVAIIGVTGNVLAEDIEYFTSAGANAVLPKPVTVALIDDFWESVAYRGESKMIHSE